MTHLNKKDIERMFKLLNEQLKSDSIEGEIYMVGGAVMCLVYNARPSTKDVDAFFQPTQKIRDAAVKVALKTGTKEDWLSDAVKGYLSTEGDFDSFLELSNLRVFSSTGEYLLAMKCLSMRIGEEFHDLDDIRYLIRHLNIKSYEKALDIITQYYPLKRFPQKTLYALEEIFEE